MANTSIVYLYFSWGLQSKLQLAVLIPRDMVMLGFSGRPQFAMEAMAIEIVDLPIKNDFSIAMLNYRNVMGSEA